MKSLKPSAPANTTSANSAEPTQTETLQPVSDQDDIQAAFYRTLLHSFLMLFALGAAISLFASLAIKSVRRSLGGEPAAATRERRFRRPNCDKC